MTFLQYMKQHIQVLVDAGCIVDTMGLAGDFIDEKLADGTFVKCNKCDGVFAAERLLPDGSCELCEKGIKRKSFGELRKEYEEIRRGMQSGLAPGLSSQS